MILFKFVQSCVDNSTLSSIYKFCDLKTTASYPQRKIKKPSLNRLNSVNMNMIKQIRIPFNHIYLATIKEFGQVRLQGFTVQITRNTTR